MFPRLPSVRPLAQGFMAVTVLSLAAGGCTTTVVQSAASSSGSPAESDRRESVACTPGDTTLPIQAFDINPDEATGTACNVGRALDADSSFAALDWAGGATHQLAGRNVTGCMAAEFSDGVTLSSLTMRMRPVGTACGHACSPGDEGCGTGWKVSVFAGPSIEKLDFLQVLSLTTAEFFEYRIAVYERFKAKFVAICREPTPAAGDDIAIESLYGFCR